MLHKNIQTSTFQLGGHPVLPGMNTESPAFHTPDKNQPK